MKLSLKILFLQVSILIGFAGFSAQASVWSETDPKINLTHIFEGEINKRGKPVGFHVVHGNDEISRINRIISGPNQTGVFTAEVQIFDAEKSKWKTKKFSSFFPEKWEKDEIIGAILNAFHKGQIKSNGKFGGPSGKGIRIEGWLCPKGARPACPDGAINTAYPIYSAGQ